MPALHVGQMPLFLYTEEVLCPTSGVRGAGREELPHVQGQGRQPGGATPRPGRSYPTSGVRGSGWEELPAAQAQEDQEELLHVQGQEGRPRPK